MASKSKRYYWLKLKEDFFEEKLIKILRKLPSGDSVTIVYLKLCLKVLKTEGQIFIDGILPDQKEEIALWIDEDVNLVRMTIEALKKYGALETIDDDTFYLNAIELMVGSECYSAKRVREHRERSRVLQSNARMLQSNNDVTECNQEKRREEKRKRREREDTEEEKEKNKNFAAVVAAYENNINLVSPLIAEKIDDWLNDVDYDVIICAIEEAVLSSARTWKYIEGILNSWFKKGIKTKIQVQEQRREWQERKNSKESDFDKIDWDNLEKYE